MRQSVAIGSFAILVLTSLNYLIYVLGYEFFAEELYIGLSMIFTVIVIIIKRVSKIEGVYKGAKNLRYLANTLVWAAIANVIVGCVITKNTDDMAYFWFSYTIMACSFVFFSFYVGKTFSGLNWFSFGPEEGSKGKKLRRKGRRGW